MSDTADSTLSALKALIAAFQTGATPVAVKTSTVEASGKPVLMSVAANFI
ncbi:TPA: hypothetical protein ACV5EY_001663 [Klebsiella aerogenes]|nr:hypothetical protein [Klebsiella aerogenes]